MFSAPLNDPFLALDRIELGTRNMLLTLEYRFRTMSIFSYPFLQAQMTL